MGLREGVGDIQNRSIVNHGPIVAQRPRLGVRSRARDSPGRTGLLAAKARPPVDGWPEEYGRAIASPEPTRAVAASTGHSGIGRRRRRTTRGR